MTISTVVAWGRGLTNEEIAGLDTQLNADVIAGETDGTYIKVIYDNLEAWERTWTDTNAAQGWVNFVNAYSQPPTVAIIQTA